MAFHVRNYERRDTWFLDREPKWGEVVDVDSNTYQRWKRIEKEYEEMQIEIEEAVYKTSPSECEKANIEGNRKDREKGDRFDCLIFYDQDEVLRVFPDAKEEDGYLYKEVIVGFRNKFQTWERKKEYE